MDQAIAMQIAITVIGSGALFSFLQFLITRKDTKAEKKEANHFKALEDKFHEDLEGRVEEGRERDEAYRKEMRDISAGHRKDFEALLEAIEQLKENDVRFAASIGNITTIQKDIAGAVMGLCHDRLVFSTDKIIERGAITVKEKATLTSIYEPYARLGGNSYAKSGYNTCMDLPIVSEEEARHMDCAIKK